MTDFFELALAQRACREFGPEPVTDAQIARVLAAAVHAPSAENRQPWEFVVVRDPVARAAIGELMAKAWSTVGRRFSEGRLAPGLFADVERGAMGGIAKAPVHVVVGADTARSLAVTAPASIFPAVQNLLLAAGAIGLGAALTTIAVGHADELRSIVGFPDAVLPIAVVPLGHPARRLGAPRRDDFSLHTHRDHYGRNW
ncbi:MAG: nitroreductase family protein [Acidimicrobiia bacterium]